MSGPIGAALLAAFQSPANSGGALLELTHPGFNTRGLKPDGTGLILDPRAGHEETSESFSVSRGKLDGAAVFKRRGSDGRGWNALTWLMEYGNGGAGLTRGEAARLLIERAGVIDTPAEGRMRQSYGPPRPRLGEQLRAKQAEVKPRDLDDVLKHLAAWEKLTGEEAEGTPERGMLAARGLLPAVQSGVLEAYRFRGHTGDARKKKRLPAALRSGAVGFVIPGPDGQLLGVKFRNPGSKAELEAASLESGQAVRRYHVPGGLGIPAWCSEGLTLKEAQLWSEGELNGVAFLMSLKSAGLGDAVGVQGMAGTDGAPHVLHDLTGKHIYIYADPDKAGDGARLKWARQAVDLGAVVYLLPAFEEGKPEQDAAAFLGAHGPEPLGAWLLSRLDTLSAWTDPEQAPSGPDVWGEGFSVWPYAIQRGEMVKLKKKTDAEDGEDARPLLGFTARIVSELLKDDGGDAPTMAYLLEGADREGRPFPAQLVLAKDFRPLAWADLWGVQAFVYPGTSVKDDARAAIVQLSREAGVNRETVYTHTGWRDLPGHGPVYLTAGACIGAAGAVPGVRVELLGRLSAYSLPEPVSGDALRKAVRASLALLELAPDSVSVPLLCLTYRAPLGDLNFASWVYAQTGSGKTTYAALYQAHYGAGWKAEHLPASWQGTANALAREAFLAKDALFILDDFKPEGAQAEVSKAHAELSRLLGSVGDRAGRSRMLPDGITIRTGPYPRGAVLTTAEDTPRKRSDVARTVMVKVSAPLFGSGAPEGRSAQFEAARQEAASGLYALAMSGYLRWVAEHYAELTGEALRRRVRAGAALFDAPHARTPGNSAELLEGGRAFLTFAVSSGAVSRAEAEQYGERITAALSELASGQGEQLEGTDPVSRFLKLLGGLLRTGAVYVRDADTGEYPERNAEALGWRWRTFGDPEGSGRWEQTNKAAAPVGYLGAVQGEPFLFLEPDAVYVAVNRAAEQGGHALPAPRMVWKLLKERLEPLGAMKCQPDRTTHLRAVHGAGTHDGRVSLLNISLPLPDLNGTDGTDNASSPTEREKSFVPFLLNFCNKDKLNGTDFGEMPSQSVKSLVPFLPSAGTPSPDAEQDARAVPVLAGRGYVLDIDP